MRVAVAILGPLVAAGLLVVGSFGLTYVRDQATYVSTDNGMVTGSLVQVSSASNALVSDVKVNPGDRVEQGQRIIVLSAASASGLPVQVRAPISGIVVARHANPGETVAAGRPIVTLVDDSVLWVEARIEETQIARIHPGQAVEVTADSVGQTIAGHVSTVGAATISSSAAATPATSSGPFVKVTQLVPVRIDLDQGKELVVGGSVYVKIRVG
ncbi:MAG TPA: HlyD family efflux transporter periplasmic adaptor subunit [Chloroflexota bacterium]